MTAVSVSPCRTTQLLEINLVRSNGSLALTGHYCVDMLPQPGILSMKEHFVPSGRQVLLLTGVADLEPGAPLLSVPLGALQHATHAAEPHPGQTTDCQVSAVTCSPDTGEEASAVTPPSPALLERLNPDQRSSFLCVWARLSPLLREVAFDVHDPGWTPLAIEQLGDVICEYPDVFSTSKTDLGSCSLMPFEILVPEGHAPVISRPHRINRILAKEVNATLNQYLAAGLIQHSTSPYSNPLLVIPKKCMRITGNYNKHNQISKLSQLPIPRVDQVLHSLGSGRVFSLFDLVSSFHRIKAHKDTVPLTAFCTSTGLYEWLVMPQGSSASPGWFVKVTNEVIQELKTGGCIPRRSHCVRFRSDSACPDDSLPLRTPSKA